MDTIFKNWNEIRNKALNAMKETEVTHYDNDEVKATLVEGDLFIIGYELSRIGDILNTRINMRH